MVRASVFAILAGALGGLVAQAAVAPYDFTGHWTGTAKTPRKPPITVSADLTPSMPQEFTGTLTFVAPDQTTRCTVTGRQQRRRVVMTMPCDNTGHAKFKGVLDPATATISGRIVWAPPPHTHKSPKQGVFTLRKQNASHARILHGPSATVAATVARTLSAFAIPADGHWALSPDRLLLPQDIAHRAGTRRSDAAHLLVRSIPNLQTKTDQPRGRRPKDG